MPDYPVSITGAVAIPDPQPATAAAIAALVAQVQALEARVAALEGSGAVVPPPSGSTGDLTVTGTLTVRGEVKVYATRGTASRAIAIIIPKADAAKANYPHLRWEAEQADGSLKFMSSIVSHRVGTNHADHTSIYVADETGERYSVIDIDTFRPHSTRRMRVENLLLQLGTGTKEAVLEADKMKVDGTVRNIDRDANGFIKGA
jgi:hypothetical protein